MSGKKSIFYNTIGNVNYRYTFVLYYLSSTVTNQTTMIQFDNLSFGYSQKKLLFKNLNLTLKSGHIYGLLGKNGAGKSTLLKNMAGLVYPTAGACTVKGFVASKRRPEFLKEVTFIPEEIYMSSETARQFVKSTSVFYPRFDHGQYARFLESFEVPDDKPLNTLSFGQQKKAMIAFGLATNTSLLIMDEPTNGLDIPSKVQFRKTIASALHDERCIVISTHQVRDLESLIDSILILHDQEIVVHKTIDELAERIQFTSAAQANKEGVLYAEPQGIGVNTISLNDGAGVQKVDLEILFNAIVNNHHAVINALN